LEEYTYQADKFVFHVRKGLLYTRDDVWIRAEPDGQFRIGLADFAQRRSGDIVFAEVSQVGSSVERGGLLGTYETVKMTKDILSPLTGMVAQTNPSLDSKPEVINSDPYGEGWVAVIKAETETGGLLTAEDYFEHMKTRVDDELKKIKGL
jgi:glycine cleavage system H protein